MTAARSPSASTTILSSIRLNGEMTYTTFSGGTSGEKFTDYLKNILIPTLKKDEIIVMDNMRSHHVKKVKNIIENAGMQLLYLPPYSLEFNPIEKMWSKIKAIFRKIKPRNIDDLSIAIKSAFLSVTPSDCKGWFFSCGGSC